MIIPNGVTDISGMFKGCSSFNDIVVVHSSVTNMNEAFSGCTSLTEVTLQIPVEKVADGTVTMTNAFQNCSSLTKVNVPAITVNDTSTWNAWRIIPDATNHQASVQCFDYQGNAKYLNGNQEPQDIIVPYGSGQNPKLEAKIETNLLSFGNIDDDTVKKVIKGHYSITANDALPPDKSSFVLWGKEDETTHKANFVTNLTLSGEVINDSTISEDRTWSSSKIVDAIYPIGSIYMSVNTTNPHDLFGGTWQTIGVGRVLWGVDENTQAGQTIEAGLPNITGKFLPYAWEGGYPSGCFYTGSNGEDYNANGRNRGKWLVFDASRSSAVYGNSNTVQPPAFTVHMWQRIS